MASPDTALQPSQTALTRSKISGSKSSTVLHSLLRENSMKSPTASPILLTRMVRESASPFGRFRRHSGALEPPVQEAAVLSRTLQPSHSLNPPQRTRSLIVQPSESDLRLAEAALRGTTDPVHVQVQVELTSHPRVARQHLVRRISRGVYTIDGKVVDIHLQETDRGMPAKLIVADGPLRQPFIDYLLVSEANAIYDTDSIAKQSALHHVPKDRRMTFDDTDKSYSRVEAMQVAKEQALLREKAAGCERDGRHVPADLMEKYTKALHRRLNPPSWAPGKLSPIQGQGARPLTQLSQAQGPSSPVPPPIRFLSSQSPAAPSLRLKQHGSCAPSWLSSPGARPVLCSTAAASLPTRAVPFVMPPTVAPGGSEPTVLPARSVLAPPRARTPVGRAPSPRPVQVLLQDAQYLHVSTRYSQARDQAPTAAPVSLPVQVVRLSPVVPVLGHWTYAVPQPLPLSHRGFVTACAVARC